jgi:hypothetical protein
MKLAISALLIASVAGFSPMSMTFSMGKKSPPKKAATKAVAKPAAKVLKKAAPKVCTSTHQT